MQQHSSPAALSSGLEVTHLQRSLQMWLQCLLLDCPCLLYCYGDMVDRGTPYASILVASLHYQEYNTHILPHSVITSNFKFPWEMNLGLIQLSLQFLQKYLPSKWSSLWQLLHHPTATGVINMVYTGWCYSCNNTTSSSNSIPWLIWGFLGWFSHHCSLPLFAMAFAKSTMNEWLALVMVTYSTYAITV